LLSVLSLGRPPVWPNFHSSVQQLVDKSEEVAIRDRLWCKMADFREPISLQQFELAGFSPVMAPLAPQQPQNSDFPFDFSELR
jgi:hypothetical protein